MILRCLTGPGVTPAPVDDSTPAPVIAPTPANADYLGCFLDGKTPPPSPVDDQFRIFELRAPISFDSMTAEVCELSWPHVPCYDGGVTFRSDQYSTL